MKAFAIARLSLRRMFSERTVLFYTALLPLLILLLVGTATGGVQTGAVPVGVVASDGPLATELVATLEESSRIEVRVYEETDELRDAVRRRTVAAGVVVPDGYDAAVRTGTADVELVADPALESTDAVRPIVAAAVADQASVLQAAAFSASLGGSYEESLSRARDVAGQGGGPFVEAETVGAPPERRFVGGFGYQAPAQVVLFVFITSAAASGMLIESRRLGVTRRMLATPTGARTVIAGEALGRFAIALTQALIVFVMSTVLFGVGWGDPLGAAAVIGLFVLVSTAAAMLLGTTFRTAEQAAAAGPPLGIAAGMLGGCMWPLEIVPEPMRVLGHLLPHAWAMDAWIGLIGRGEGIGGVAVELGVLAGFAAVLLPLSVRRLRRAVTG